MNYTFTKDENISDIVLIDTDSYKDSRGILSEIYNKDLFSNLFEDVVQIKYAFSYYGVLRGLHFQLQPYAQGKLIKCVKGSIFDIAVDIRRNSPTFGRWIGHILSEDNSRMMYIPPGFAHGVLTISKNDSLFYYITTEQFSKEHESGLLWSDPAINIQLPIPHTDVILSDKDKELPNLESI